MGSYFVWEEENEGGRQLEVWFDSDKVWLRISPIKG